MSEASSTMQRAEPVQAGVRPPRGVVLGIGNTLLTDEAAGVRVLDALRERPELDGVSLIDGGTLSFTLLEYIEAIPALVVVDAGYLGADPGTVRSFEGEAMDEFLGSTRQRTVHEVGLIDLLAIARLRDSLPTRRALVCIQPAEVGLGLELSPAVQAAVASAAEAVVDQFTRWQS